MMRVLLIDNYDSFTYNLAQYLWELEAEVLVHRNDALTLSEAEKLTPTHIVLSPGPGHPANPRDFGICAPIIEHLSNRYPILGVCLGHQGIIQVLGGNVVRAPQIVHGKASQVRHDGTGLFAGLPAEIEVMRYHSLIGDRASLPPTLRITAETVTDGLIMAVEHVERPLYGIQFHPESIGTPHGHAILSQFLKNGTGFARSRL